LVFHSSTITMMHGPINIRSMKDIWWWRRSGAKYSHTFKRL